MRAIFIFFILTLFFLFGCASVEVAKEVTKATKSIGTSFKKIIIPPEEEQKKHEILITKQDNEQTDKEILITKQDNEQREKEIIFEKQEINKEQKKIIKVIKKQKKIASIKILNKTMDELILLIDKPNLIRNDGNTTMVRYDSNSCRLFLFMNSNIKTPIIEYYELRNTQGQLLENQKDIKLCFKELKPT